jgi:hypothetical protein
MAKISKSDLSAILDRNESSTVWKRSPDRSMSMSGRRANFALLD